MDPETEQDISTANRAGEVRIKSPYVMHSYVNNPEATANAFDSQGYYKTGDLLYVDEHGFFFFVDRIKEILKYKSNQVTAKDARAVFPEKQAKCSQNTPVRSGLHFSPAH